MKPFMPELDMSGSPTVYRFMTDRSFVRVILGPVGSGKTTGMCAAAMIPALQQKPGRDGWAHYKIGIVRNTAPELKQTTIPTWTGIFKEEACGQVVMSSPIRQRIRVPWGKAGPALGGKGLHVQVEFLGLDKPKDVRKLLSWEVSLIMFNEVREIPRVIFSRSTERVGRYPSQDAGECLFAGVMADSNMPDEDHWLHEYETGERPIGWDFYRQHKAVVEMRQVGPSRWEAVAEEGVDHVVTKASRIARAAGREWATLPDAENLYNHRVLTDLDPEGDPLGPGSYYQRILPGKSLDEIRVYYQARYGYVADGKPVVPEYDDEIMSSDSIKVIRDRPLMVGLDIGGGTLNPAAVFAQRSDMGGWAFHDEVVCPDMGLEAFWDHLRATYRGLLAREGLSEQEMPIEVAYGDPAGEKRDEIYEVSAFQFLQGKGLPIQAAPSNDIRLRIDAWKAPMRRRVGRGAGIVIHRRCVMLRRGLMGRWAFRRIAMPGEERYREVPDKNEFSHACDAGGYVLSGGGEHDQLVLGGQGAFSRFVGQGGAVGPLTGATEFDPFGA